MIKDLIKIIRKFYGEGEVKLHPAEITGEDRDEVVKTMFCRTDCYGYAVSAFEQGLSEYTGAKHVILTASGTAALYAIANCTRYDQAVIPNYSFKSTHNAFIKCDQCLWVFFVDTDTKMLMDSCQNHELEEALIHWDTAYVPVHLFGHFCKYDGYYDIIEDACQALGTFYNGKHSGTFGRAGAISFNGNKIITTGGGGAVLTDDDELAENIREFVSRGFNLRMPALNAALGISQLSRIEETIAKKK